MSLRSIGVVLWLVVACTKSEPVAESAVCCTNDAPADHDHAQKTAHDQQHATNTASAATGGSLSSIKVVADVTRTGAVVRVQNHGDQTLKLAARMKLSRVAAGAVNDVVADAFVLRATCDAPVPAGCVALAPGAELLPPACVALTPGDYEVSVAECEGSSSAKSERFVVGAGDAR